MIWSDPIYKTRSALIWMAPETGFHPGMAERVEAAPATSLKKVFLQGQWIRLRAERESAEEGVVNVLANLKDYADQVLYLRASQVLTFQREREDHPATGLKIGATLDEVDVIVVSGFQALPAWQMQALDGLLSVRGIANPPRITITMEPTTGAALPTTEEEYGNRILLY